jgi:outer membrane autotransporter protein
MKIPSSAATWTALTLASVSLLFGAAAARAGDSGFYLGADAGVAVADGHITSLDLSGNTTAYASLKAGGRVDLFAGYAFRLSDKWSLGPEVEVGYVYNSFDKASYSGQGTSGAGDVNQVPVLANGILTYHFTPKLSAYVGAGVGLEYLHIVVPSDSTVSNLATKQGGIDCDAKLGVQYQLGPGDLGLSYQYLGVFPGFYYKSFGSHCIAASYTFHF